MKKIVPFNNVLEFETDVKEITAISLEHEINKDPDMISGVFYISGEYKITEGLLDKEKFNFELPFDIALSNNYKIDTLIVDIDDFRYDLISDKSLKVNIDLYIDGEVEEPEPRYITEESEEFFNKDELEELLSDSEDSLPVLEDTQEDTEEESDNNKFKEEMAVSYENHEEKLTEEELIEPERIDLLKEMLTDNKENNMPENINIDNDVENENINIFDNNKEEKYVTYRVYKVEENDTIDTILTKYNISKELLSDYNNIENIIPGDKLIIPTDEK